MSGVTPDDADRAFAEWQDAVAAYLTQKYHSWLGGPLWPGVSLDYLLERALAAQRAWLAVRHVVEHENPDAWGPPTRLWACNALEEEALRAQGKPIPLGPFDPCKRRAGETACRCFRCFPGVIEKPRKRRASPKV